MESITTNCLINLAFDLSNDWRELARVLDLSEEVSRICEDYRRNVFEQAYRMLKTWVGKKGSKATYQVLREALAHETVLRNDLVQKYCEGRNRSSLDEGKRLESSRSFFHSASNNKSGEIYRELQFLGRDFIYWNSWFTDSWFWHLEENIVHATSFWIDLDSFYADHSSVTLTALDLLVNNEMKYIKLRN